MANRCSRYPLAFSLPATVPFTRFEGFGKSDADDLKDRIEFDQKSNENRHKMGPKIDLGRGVLGASGGILGASGGSWCRKAAISDRSSPVGPGAKKADVSDRSSPVGFGAKRQMFLTGRPR